MESFVKVCAFLSFSFPFSFGSVGIGESFCVPFLLRMCMIFLLIFIFRFLIFVSAIMHSECMNPWAFYCTLGPLIAPMLMSLVFSCVKDWIKSSREDIF
jgi:hypothetical protein